jgi:hypothetical protein
VVLAVVWCVLFVKEHFAGIKSALGPGTPHKEVMSALSSKWKDAQ